MNTSSGIIDFYVVKTDPSGNIPWSNVSGGTSIEGFNDLIEASDHSIVGAGVDNTGSMIAVKFDENGNLQRSRDINNM